MNWKDLQSKIRQIPDQNDEILVHLAFERLPVYLYNNKLYADIPEKIENHQISITENDAKDEVIDKFLTFLRGKCGFSYKKTESGFEIQEY